MELINITFDTVDPGAACRVLGGATERQLAESTPDVALQTSATDPVRLLFLKVSDRKAVKNRMHLDFQAADRAAEVARLRGLGATEHDTHQEHGMTWTVMTDPEGTSSASCRHDCTRQSRVVACCRQQGWCGSRVLDGGEPVCGRCSHTSGCNSGGPCAPGQGGHEAPRRDLPEASCRPGTAGLLRRVAGPAQPAGHAAPRSAPVYSLLAAAEPAGPFDGMAER